jgi:ATP-dependent RNA helicase DeaD
MEQNNFEQYELRAELLKALAEKGFSTPTPVQDRVLSEKIFEKDIIVRAKTGSGKTLAFLLPLLQKITAGERESKVLILSPTRELSQQIWKEAKWFGNYINVSAASLVGGMDMSQQIRSLRDGSAVVTGTPGRVLDHIRRGTLDTSGIKIVVLDEGDHMLDLGFKEELEAILDSLPNCQRVWLFSATMPAEIKNLAKRYLKTPVFISLTEEGEAHEDITHEVYLVPTRHKEEGLINVLLWEKPSRAIVFCHTRAETVELTRRLHDENFQAMCLHGEMSQRERNMALSQFRSGRTPLLVATNVAARGLDVEGVSHVIQMGLPDNRETFVHMSGRTGRAGHEGRNLLVLSPKEATGFKSMVKTSTIPITWKNVPDPKDIRKKQRISYEERVFAAEHYETPENLEWADSLLECNESRAMIARLLGLLFSRKNAGYELTADLEQDLKRGRTPRRSRSKESGSAGSSLQTTIRIERGRDQGWDVGKILRVICSTLNIDKSGVGAIRLQNDHAQVELLPSIEKDFERFGHRLIERGLITEGRKSYKAVEKRGKKPFRQRKKR